MSFKKYMFPVMFTLVSFSSYSATLQQQLSAVAQAEGEGKQIIESFKQMMSKIIGDAWQTMTGLDHNGITNMTAMIINRADRGAFTTPFNQLKAQVQTMQAPVATARTGIAG